MGRTDAECREHDFEQLRHAVALIELLVDLSDGCRHLFALRGISSGTSEETIRVSLKNLLSFNFYVVV
jgi:hypothetical protein